MSAQAAELRRATDLIDAFNQADWDRLRGVLAPDVRYSETGTGRQVEGADAYLQLCQGWKEAFADAEGTVTNAAGGEDGDIAEASNNGRETMDHRPHPGLLRPRGHIGFLGHGSVVEFRNIRIMELD